jgi:hypothetical protein
MTSERDQAFERVLTSCTTVATITENRATAASE